MTSPMKPSIEIQSPSLTTVSSTEKVRAAMSMSSTPQPTMQTLPIWRATSAAWLVMPPWAVRMPCAASMPRMSSGLVKSRTSRTCSPRSAQATASAALNTTRPVAAPGPAGRPQANAWPPFSAACSSWARKTGRRSWFNWSGSMRMSASWGLIRPWSAMSTAMRMAARPVRLPLRVCSMKRRPRSIVNSKSCMSRISRSRVSRTSMSWSKQSGQTCLSSIAGRGVRTPETTSSPWALTRNSP